MEVEEEKWWKKLDSPSELISHHQLANKQKTTVVLEDKDLYGRYT